MKIFLTSALFFFLVSCSGSSDQQGSSSTASGPANQELSAFEMEHGIGPVKQEVVLGEIDPARVAIGKEIFEMKCTSCHKTGDRYIGPDLLGVETRHSPAYVMNMILNPTEMTQRHPKARALLAEFLAPMPFQNVSEEDARNILEYLRSVNTNTQTATP